MNTASLVEAIRSEHYLLEAMWGCSDPRCCGVYDEDREDRCAICGTPWPCLSSVAADRLEAGLSVEQGNVCPHGYEPGEPGCTEASPAIADGVQRTMKVANQSLTLDLVACEEALARVKALCDEADGEPRRLFWPSEILAAVEGTDDA